MKIVVSMNSSDLVTDYSGLNISPISAIDQNNNNISFSMEESSQQSQFSQSDHTNKLDKNYYESTKIESNTGREDSSGRSVIDRFEGALHELELLKGKLKQSNLSEEKSALLDFMDELTTYSLYSIKRVKNETSRSGLGSKKISLSSINPNLNSSACEPMHFHGIKLEGCEGISGQILKRIFGSSEFGDYFQAFQAVKISNNAKHLGLYWAYMGQNLRILNLSHNQLRGTSFLK